MIPYVSASNSNSSVWLLRLSTDPSHPPDVIECRPLEVCNKHSWLPAGQVRHGRSCRSYFFLLLGQRPDKSNGLKEIRAFMVGQNDVSVRWLIMLVHREDSEGEEGWCLGPQPTSQCDPHSGWVFSHQLNTSGKTHRHAQRSM